MKTRPPIVGVPRLSEWPAGLMSRIGWPALSFVSARIAKGVPTREMTNATQTATMTDPTAVMRVHPGRRRSASATSQVRYREPLTSTTSPGRSSSRSSAIAAL